MRSGKWRISWMVAVATVALCAATARADSEVVDGVTWVYDVTNGTATVTWAQPMGGNMAVPATLGGLPVVGIGGDVFSKCGGLVSVAIPEGVKSIGGNAFRECSGLEAVGIPDSLEEFGFGVFYGCGNLKSVVLGTGARSFGEQLFTACGALESIDVAPGNPYCESLDGVLFSKGGKKLICCPGGRQGAYAVPDGVEEIGDYALAQCGELTSVTLPGSVKTIKSFAFAYSGNLEEVVLREGLERIQTYAFYQCGRLAAVEIPSSVAAIGHGAFEGCRELEAIRVAPGNARFESADGVLFSKGMASLLCCPGAKPGAYAIPDGVTCVATQAFSGCTRLTAVSFPDSVEEIGVYSFYDCGGLEDVAIGRGVKAVRSYAFSHCRGLKTVSIPASLESIEMRAFFDCSALESVSVDADNAHFESDGGVLFTKGKGELICYPPTKAGPYAVPAGVTNISWDAFYRCNGLTAVSIPGSVSRIGYEAFRECAGLMSVEMAEGVRDILTFAFHGCPALVEVALPASVRGIDHYAFAGCESLQRIEVAPGSAYFESADGVLFTKGLRTLVCCPSGRTGRYVIPDGVEAIGANSFGSCAKLTEVVIPDGVVDVGGGAFSGCGGLTEMTLPASVTNVGSYALNNCGNLAVLRVPASWQGTAMLKPAAVPEGCDIVYYPTETSSTPVPVPYVWLEKQAPEILEREGGDHEAAANAVATNGVPVWGCYLAGLSVTNAESVFRVKSISFPDGKATVEWEPDLNEGGTKSNRTYRVEGLRTMTNKWNSAEPDSQFFRVWVGMPK